MATILGSSMTVSAGKWIIILSICIFSICARAPQLSVKSQSERNPAVIHENVGTFIEPEEREYYGLFRGIVGFQEAVFFKRDDYGYDILILSEEHSYYSKYDGSQAEEILHDYIEHYDEINMSRDDFEKKWKIAGYDTLGFPVTENDVERMLRMLAEQRNTPMAYCCGTIGCFLGSIYGIRNIEAGYDQASHIPSCTVEEEALLWSGSGCFSGILLGYWFEQNYRRRYPTPYINKQRGPWIIE